MSESKARDRIARMMAAKGGSECGRFALASITGSTERSRQVAYNRSAELFMDEEETTEQERAQVAEWVRVAPMEEAR